MMRPLLCRRRVWLKMAVIVALVVALYEIHYIIMTSQCSDEDLRQSLTALCDEYRRGQLSGDLCPALCDKRQVSYENCLNYRHGKRVVTVKYRGDRMVLKAKHGYFSEYPDLSYTFENKTFFPEVQDFNKMLIDILFVNFGVKIPERRDMLTRLWTIPFHDLKSEAEIKASMRSVWSLVQQDEYMIFKFFDNVNGFPKIKGSCGFYYAVEHAPPGAVLGTKPLMVSDDSNWDERKNIAIKFLDLLANLHSALDGRFHICDVKAENFGLNSDGELKVIDVDMAFFDKRIHEQFDLETCRSDKDCRILDCHGKCDMEKKTCMKKRINSNLQAVCSKIFSHSLSTGYRGLLRYPPSLLKDPLEAMLYDCSRLTSNTDQVIMDQIQPDTVYWKLKNLLKKSLAGQIADYVGF